MKQLCLILIQAVRLQRHGKILVLEEVVAKLGGIRLVATLRCPRILRASVKHLHLETPVYPSKDIGITLPEPQIPTSGGNNTPAEQPIPASTIESTLGIQTIPTGGEDQSGPAQGSLAAAPEVPAESRALVTFSVTKLLKARKLPIRKSA